MKNTLTPYLLVLAFSTIVFAETPLGQGAEAVVAGFDARVDAMFRAETGKPLVRAKKNPPLSRGVETMCGPTLIR
jgi:hypothetical protein